MCPFQLHEFTNSGLLQIHVITAPTQIFVQNIFSQTAFFRIDLKSIYIFSNN